MREEDHLVVVDSVEYFVAAGNYFVEFDNFAGSDNFVDFVDKRVVAAGVAVVVVAAVVDDKLVADYEKLAVVVVAVGRKLYYDAN